MSTSLIKKAIDKDILKFHKIDARDFTTDKHKKIDDDIYGGWAGMLMMAQPMIDAVNSVLSRIKWDFKIVFPSPSKDIWDQTSAHSFSKIENLIFVWWRYEGIDHRFVQYFQDKYPDKFAQISLGKFVTLWGELPIMVMIESIVRLIPWVIKEELSWQDESYAISQNMENLEYPQYTRPQEVAWYKVPEVLLNWNHKEIEKRRKENSK